MKNNWTCYAGALELILASCFIRQFMRLIVHFHSKLTSNYHRVFVITSFCDHMWNLVVYLLLKYAFYSLYIAAKMSISDVHIHLKKITYKPYPIVIVCLLSYIIYSGCCHVYFCCVKHCMLWLKLTLFVMLQAPLRSEVARYTFQKTATHGSVIFPATVFSK